MNPNQIDIVKLFKQESIPLKQLLLFVSGVIKKTLKILIILLLIASVSSFVHYKLAPLEYETIVSVYVDQVSNNTAAGIGGVSNMLGVNISGLGSTTSNLMGPDMYQDIVKSRAFLNEIVSSKIPINRTNRKFSTLEKLLTGNNIDLLKSKKQDTSSLIKSEITPELILSNELPPIVEINGSRANSMGLISNKISIDVEEGLCILKVKMNDPFLSAVVSRLVLEKLIEYVTFYKTNKLRNNLNYLQERLYESEIKYKNAQSNLSSFKDRNIGSIFQSSIASEQVLSNDVTSTFAIYNQLKGQIEQANLELKKETPLFAVLEPITVPSAPSNPIVINLFVYYFGLAMGLYFLIVIYFIVNPFIKFYAK